MLLGRRLVERLGLRGFFVVGCLMYLVAVGSWIVFDDPMVLVASRVLTGLGFGAFTVSSVVALGILLPEELQASGQAFGHRPSSPSPSLGTCSVGSSTVFWALRRSFHRSLGPVLGAILAWRWLPGRRDPSIPPSVTDVQEAEVR